MHHINVDTLRKCFDELDGKKAIGVDGISKEEYGKNLQSNLQNLTARMKSMSYRPGLVLEVLIPKEGKPNATRPLGLSNFEDKLVQKKMHEILESIYDPIYSRPIHMDSSQREIAMMQSKICIDICTLMKSKRF